MIKKDQIEDHISEKAKLAFKRFSDVASISMCDFLLDVADDYSDIPTRGQYFYRMFRTISGQNGFAFLASVDTYSPLGLSLGACVVDPEGLPEEDYLILHRLKYETTVGGYEIYIPESTSSSKILSATLNREAGFFSLGTLILKGISAIGTDIDISNVFGISYNYDNSSAATNYTFKAPVNNGYATCLINAATEPVVTGATKIAGATFAANTNMEMVVESKDGVNARYFFLKL